MNKLLLIAAISASGCGKPSDVPALREEADSIVARTGPRVAAVKFRLGAVKMVFDSGEHKYANAPDYARAKGAVNEGMAEVGALENDLARSAHELEEAQKDETGTKLVTFNDEKREQWEQKLTRATADAETGEIWLSRMQADAVAQAATPPKPETPTEPTETTAPPL